MATVLASGFTVREPSDPAILLLLNPLFSLSTFSSYTVEPYPFFFTEISNFVLISTDPYSMIAFSQLHVCTATADRTPMQISNQRC